MAVEGGETKAGDDAGPGAGVGMGVVPAVPGYPRLVVHLPRARMALSVDLDPPTGSASTPVSALAAGAGGPDVTAGGSEAKTGADALECALVGSMHCIPLLLDARVGSMVGLLSAAIAAAAIAVHRPIADNPLPTSRLPTPNT